MQTSRYNETLGIAIKIKFNRKITGWINYAEVN